MSKNADVLIEAAERLELLGFDFEGDVVKSILSGEKPRCSDETIFVFDIVRELTDEEWQRVKEFQERFNVVVYHVIHSNLGEIGIMDAYLYISLPLTSFECEQDRFDIKDKRPLAYVHNITNPEFSEFGSIGVEFQNNAIARTD